MYGNFDIVITVWLWLGVLIGACNPIDGMHASCVSRQRLWELPAPTGSHAALPAARTKACANAAGHAGGGRRLGLGDLLQRDGFVAAVVRQLRHHGETISNAFLVPCHLTSAV